MSGSYVLATSNSCAAGDSAKQFDQAWGIKMECQQLTRKCRADGPANLSWESWSPPCNSSKIDVDQEE